MFKIKLNPPGQDKKLSKDTKRKKAQRKRGRTYDFHVSFLQEEKRTRVLVICYKILEKKLVTNNLLTGTVRT